MRLFTKRSARLRHDSYFKDFPHQASEMQAYLLAGDIFIVSLKNGEIIKHHPDDSAAFREWLKTEDVRDINETKHLK